MTVSGGAATVTRVSGAAMRTRGPLGISSRLTH